MSDLYAINKSTPSLRDEVVHYGLVKAKKTATQSFLLAIFAGSFIALAFVFYITVTTGASGSWGVNKLIGGLAFSMGLILVVVCGAELFTSTILNSVAWAEKRLSTLQMLRCWGRVFVGNLCGALLILGLILLAQMYQLNDGAWGENAISIAQHKLHHNFFQAFALGVLCNLLVCLGIWMSLSTKEPMAKSMLLLLPVAMFVSSGFEHSIANLFMVPLGISLRYLAEAGLYSLPQMTITQLNDLTIYHFIFNNLIPVALGNIVGGILLIALGKEFTQKPAKLNTTQLSKGERNMPKLTIANKTVQDLADKNPLTVSVDTSLKQLMELLVTNQLRSIAVVNSQQQLLGMVSEQDLLRHLWGEEFDSELAITAGDLMQTEVIVVALTDKIDDMIEYMTVDRDKLFPVNDSGAYLGGAYHSYEERLKRATTNKPSSYPVINDGKFVGMLNRSFLLAQIRQELSPKLELSADQVA